MLFGLQAPVIVVISLCVGYAALLIFAIRRRGWRNWQIGALTGFLILSAIWTIGFSLTVWLGLRADMPLVGLHVAADALAALSPLLVVLTLLFLERPGAKWVALLGGVLVVFILAIDLNLLQLQYLLLGLRMAVWGGFSAGVLILALLDFVQTRRPLHRNRILFWLLGLIAIIGGECLTQLDKTSFLIDVVQIGLFIRFIGAMVITVAMTNYHLPVLRTFARQALAAIITTLLLGGLILVGVLIVLTVAHEDNIVMTLIAAVSAAVVLAIIQQPVRMLLQRGTDRWLSSGHYDPARALRDYGDAISNILDLDTLVTVATGIIADALDVRRGTLMLITESEDGGAEVLVMPGMGMGTLALAHFGFQSDSPVLYALRHGNMPVTHYEIDILPTYRTTSPWERSWLQSLDMEVYVPVRSQGLLIGVLAFGSKGSNEPYTAQDLNVLLSVGNQTATVLQNARLVSDLKSANRSIMQLNDDLLASNRRLEKLDLAKTDFIEIASHELRTPLTQIWGYADILTDQVKQGDGTPAQLTQITQGITRASARLEQIITAMLDVSRIDTQQLDIRPTPLSIAAVWRMAIDNYKEAIQERQLNLRVTDLETLPQVPGDLKRLGQAFSNLLGNAIKFTPNGGTISISGQVLKEPEKGLPTHVELLIADTGIGIDPDDQILIFEKFYRVGAVELHSTGSTKFKGAGPGLGLPIAKGVIQAHGGKIWVESPGHDETKMPGSTFHILLPAMMPAANNG